MHWGRWRGVDGASGELGTVGSAVDYLASLRNVLPETLDLMKSKVLW